VWARDQEAHHDLGLAGAAAAARPHRDADVRRARVRGGAAGDVARQPPPAVPVAFGGRRAQRQPHAGLDDGAGVPAEQQPVRDRLAVPQPGGGARGAAPHPGRLRQEDGAVLQHQRAEEEAADVGERQGPGERPPEAEAAEHERRRLQERERSGVPDQAQPGQQELQEQRGAVADAAHVGVGAADAARLRLQLAHVGRLLRALDHPAAEEPQEARQRRAEHAVRHLGRRDLVEEHARFDHPAAEGLRGEEQPVLDAAQGQRGQTEEAQEQRHHHPTITLNCCDTRQASHETDQTSAERKRHFHRTKRGGEAEALAEEQDLPPVVPGGPNRQQNSDGAAGQAGREGMGTASHPAPQQPQLVRRLRLQRTKVTPTIPIEPNCQSEIAGCVNGRRKRRTRTSRRRSLPPSRVRSSKSPTSA
jgi:hypothetical protein